VPVRLPAVRLGDSVFTTKARTLLQSEGDNSPLGEEEVSRNRQQETNRGELTRSSRSGKRESGGGGLRRVGGG